MKDKTCGIDCFGQIIYQTSKKHRSMKLLDKYIICSHICPNFVHGFKLLIWDHRVPPGLSCHLCLYQECEDCLTYGYSISNEEKIALMPEHHQEIIKRWKAKHPKKG